MRENHNVSRNYYETQGPLHGEEFARQNGHIRKAIVPLLARRVKGRTLLVGWSPTLMFTPPAAERFVVADFAFNVLKKTPRRLNVGVVCAKAEQLPFDRGTFDTVMMVGLLHHLAEDNNVETDSMTHNALGEAARMMKRDAKLYIVEPLVGPFLEVVLRSFYFIARLFLNKRGLPMMCLFSRENLKVMLGNEGLELKYATPIGMDGVVPVSWFLPKFRLRYNYLPQKIYLLEVHKSKDA